MGRKHGTLHTIELLANSAGFQKIYRRDTGTGMVFWRIVCSRCTVRSDHRWQPNTSPELMIRNMRRQHWDVDFGQEPLCPDCKGCRPHSARHIKPGQHMAAVYQQETSVTIPVEPPQGPQPNLKITRVVMALLDVQFDEKSRLYAAGWDDARVARQAQTAVGVVQKIRTEAYGELAEDPKVSEFRAAMDGLETEILTLGSKLDDLRKRFDGFVTNRKLGGIL